MQLNRELIRRPPTALTVIGCNQTNWPQSILFGDSTGSIHLLDEQSNLHLCGDPHGAAVSLCDKNIVHDTLLTGSWDGTVGIHQISESSVRLLSRWYNNAEGRVLMGQWAPFRITPNAFILVSETKGSSGEMTLYDVRVGTTAKIRAPHHSPIYSCKWLDSQSGHQVVTGDKIGTLALWDLRQPLVPITSIPKYSGRGPERALRVGCTINGIDHSPKDDLIWSCGTDRMIRCLPRMELMKDAIDRALHERPEITTGIISIDNGKAYASSMDGSVVQITIKTMMN